MFYLVHRNLVQLESLATFSIDQDILYRPVIVWMTADGWFSIIERTMRYRLKVVALKMMTSLDSKQKNSNQMVMWILFCTTLQQCHERTHHATCDRWKLGLWENIPWILCTLSLITAHLRIFYGKSVLLHLIDGQFITWQSDRETDRKRRENPLDYEACSLLLTYN